MTYTGYDNQIGTQIDHVCVNNNELINVDSCKVLDDCSTNTSDHLAVVICIKMSVERFIPKLRSVYRWEKGDVESFRTHVENINVDVFDGVANDINGMVHRLCQTLIRASEQTIPKSKFCPYHWPYWDEELKILHAQQREMRRTWVVEGRPRGRQFQSFRLYKEAQSKFAKALRYKEYTYEQKRLESIEESHEIDIRKFWRMIRSHKESIHVIHSIQKDGKLYTTPEVLREMWKMHYHDLFNENIENTSYDQEFKVFVDSTIYKL